MNVLGDQHEGFGRLSLQTLPRKPLSKKKARGNGRLLQKGQNNQEKITSQKEVIPPGPSSFVGGTEKIGQIRKKSTGGKIQPAYEEEVRLLIASDKRDGGRSKCETHLKKIREKREGQEQKFSIEQKQRNKTRSESRGYGTSNLD